MFDLNDIIDSYINEYADYENDRLKNSMPGPDKEIYIKEIFRICHLAIDESSKGHNPDLTRQRYRSILKQRFRDGATLDEIGEAMDLSRERVRQLERDLLNMIRHYIRKNCPEEMEVYA